jgi:hypothetical protein
MSLNGEGGLFLDETVGTLETSTTLKLVSGDASFRFRCDTVETRDKWLTAVGLERASREGAKLWLGIKDDAVCAQSPLPVVASFSLCARSYDVLCVSCVQPAPLPAQLYRRDGRVTGVALLPMDDDPLLGHRSGSVWSAVQEEQLELQKKRSVSSMNSTSAESASISVVRGPDPASAKDKDSKSPAKVQDVRSASTEALSDMKAGDGEGAGRRTNSLFSPNNLEGMKADQRIFFGFVCSRLRSLEIVTRCLTPSMEVWNATTGATDASGAEAHSSWLGDKRGEPTRKLDRALELYSNTCRLCFAVIKHSRYALLLRGVGVGCGDDDSLCLSLCVAARSIVVSETSVNATGQVGFAFPRFDEHVFDLGRFSIISPWQFFARDTSSGAGAGVDSWCSFTEDTWRGALNSRSSGTPLPVRPSVRLCCAVLCCAVLCCFCSSSPASLLLHVLLCVVVCRRCVRCMRCALQAKSSCSRRRTWPNCMRPDRSSSPNQ